MGGVYDQLYSAGPGAGSQQLEVRVPRNAPATAPYALPFTAHSVRVENASGIWYSINGEQVPPWTIGAVIVLPQPSAALDIRVATPGGQTSDDEGNDLVVTAYEEEQAPSSGVLSPQKLLDLIGEMVALTARVSDVLTAINRQAIYDQAEFPFPVLSNVTQLTATEAGMGFVTIVGPSGTATRRILGLQASLGVTVGGRIGTRGVTTVEFRRNLPAAQTLARLALSPGQPNASVPVAPGAMEFSAASDLQVRALLDAGSGGGPVWVAAQWYALA